MVGDQMTHKRRRVQDKKETNLMTLIQTKKKKKNLMTLVTLIYVKNESHVDRIRGVVWTYK